jgi:Sec7-like guanine-nucleotide exchange factor
MLLGQIFLNYDCDMEAKNLYKDIVQNLTKLSARSSASALANMTKKEMEQDYEISLAAIEVLVSILKAFLKALNLPGGEEGDEGDSTAARLLKSLQIDVGVAAKPKLVEKKEAKEEDISEKDFRSPNKSKANEIVGAFETKRAQEQSFETGVVKFNLSLKTGLKYFIDHGFVDLEAKSIALFFLEHKDKLEKTMIGEALGREPDASFVKEEGVDPEKGGPGFWFRILEHYVDAFDFTGLMFDEAIRQFQSGFRLPGEAQKIDRIMEKFAERYTRQNLDVFPTADTAFILAFSVIMLNTDLHNPSIKEEKKMTVESFLRNNRGIANGKDLPDEVLIGIFQRIKARPFSLKEDDEARAKLKEQEVLQGSYFFEGPSFFGGSAEDRKKEKFRKEKEEMMNATEQLFKKRVAKNKASKAAESMTEFIDPADIVKPMFDVTWGPLLGTISQVLECTTDDRIIAVCLNGFVYAVRIAAHSEMSLARDTFVNSLAKFTFLGSIKEMKHKNIESIRTLLSIAVIDGEYLDESWGPVLQCISQLARLRLFASGLDSDEAFLNEIGDTKLGRDPNDNDLADGSGLFRQQTKAEINRETEEVNSRAVVAAFNEVLIDKVFSSTVTLSARSIAHFIEQLVEVSAMEIAGGSKRGISGVGTSSRKLDSSKKVNKLSDEGPRIFSLQKLVEVADFNMGVRPRLAWAQVWEILANHFAKVGCHKNSMVSLFAIDSLRQLSFKFLEKPERSDFSFQKIFLKPFYEIMLNNNTREDIREMILRCVDNMIRTMSHNLRSGWAIFFSILKASASDPSERINTLGLAILQRLLDEHLHQLCRLHYDDDGISSESLVNEKKELTPVEKRHRNSNVDDFVNLCRASLAFIQTDYNTSPLPIGLSMRALCHTACYADLIKEQQILPPVSGFQSVNSNQPGYTYDGLEGDDALGMVLWRTLLDGLALGIRSTLPSNAGGVGCLVQRGSVMALRAILLRHGNHFSNSQWKAILIQTLIPAIQIAAESDGSAVVMITSESPSISSVDFLAEPLSLPPDHNDDGLRMFAEQAANAESAPTRSLGEAELLVEASFTDMRHGGSGNLSRAYELAKKGMSPSPHEQPFPDSWVATTGPIALGTLTDITTEIILKRGFEGRELLWPAIQAQYQAWIIGRSNLLGEAWQPCEALVRISCRELHRLSYRLNVYVSNMAMSDRRAWSSIVINTFAHTLNDVVEIEICLKDELIRAKTQAYGVAAFTDGSFHDEPEDEIGKVVSDVIMYTPYGKGKLIERRKESYQLNFGKVQTLVMNCVKLEFGGILYRPAPGSVQVKNKVQDEKIFDQEDSIRQSSPFVPRSFNATRETWWGALVPALKIRCVGVYCLQHYLLDLFESYILFVSKDDVNDLLKALNKSKALASKASEHEDLSHAFQESMFSQWSDGVIEVEEVLSNTGRLSRHRGSAMFFLTQEAGAMNDIIHMLSLLYQFDQRSEEEWDRGSFAEIPLMINVEEVLHKFVESEKKDGYLIDPNVWRNASESGGKLAIYCTSFAVVVVNILHVMLKMRPERFTKHVHNFFPILCSMITVQSDEIRILLKSVLEQQITPLLK